MPKTRAHTVPESVAIPSFTRILLVTDFSACSVAAVPFARLLADYYRASIVLVHVVPAEPQVEGSAPHPNEPKPGTPHSLSFGEGGDRTTDALGAPLQAQAASAKSRELAAAQLSQFLSENPIGEASYELVVRQGPVWEVLAALVEEKKIDLIVLGTHGRSGVGKLLMGSVAQRIFSLAPCPVLTVSPRASRSWGPDQRLARILFATDFSPASLKALPYALSLAKVGHAKLLLLHAPESSAATSSEIVVGYQQHLNALIPPRHRNWCRSDTLVEAGDPAQAIVDAAERNSVDFIVLGAHAIEGSLATFQVPLSTAYRVVAHAPCPVLRVRS